MLLDSTLALRILVVDDNADIRVLVTFVLSRDPTFVLVGEAENGESALAFVRQHRPDVVVMDLLMPSVGGLEATRQIKHESPGTKVLVLTSLNDDQTISARYPSPTRAVGESPAYLGPPRPTRRSSRAPPSTPARPGACRGSRRCLRRP